MRTDRDYAESMELVESVMEWIGMRWTPSMIKRELRECFGNDLSFQTCNYLIKAANKEIRKRYNIDPQEYKGIQITFYESIIRNKSEKTKNQLTAAERLDKLFGLEQVTADDPEIQARKIREALKEMDESIGEQDNGDEQTGSVDVGDGEVETRSVSGESSGDDQQNEEGKTISGQSVSNENLEAEVAIEDDNISQEAAEKELKTLSDDDLKRFRKSRG